MRKRIWRMSEDKFDNRRPKLILSTDALDLVARPGEPFTGSFSFKSQDEQPIKGLIYSSHPFVVVNTSVFSGTEVNVSFQLRGKHYREGDRLDGCFTIVYNGGEHRLPFAVVFQAEKLKCSRGEINTLADFAELAKTNWSEANRIFYSQGFADFMASRPVAEQLLYEGYRKAIPSPRNLEEFLVSCGCKPRISFKVDKNNIDYYLVSENLKESLEITKSAWGYISMKVTVDAPFITVEQQEVNTDYFLGSMMTLNYYIHREKLHQGKNYGRITISAGGQVQEVEIMATTMGEEEEKLWARHQVSRELALLTSTYVDYRFRRITTGEWTDTSLRILDDLARLEYDATWIALMRAQCYVINQQRQEALWIISDLKIEIQDKSSVEWAYLLYLCTLIEKEESYVDRLTKEIEVIFRRHGEDPRIFWFLQFLRKEYMENPARRLLGLEQWLEAGHESPFFYIEAYSILVQNPFLLRQFTPVRLQTLHWAARKGLLTKELSQQIGHVLASTEHFSGRLWQVVEAAYEANPTDEFFQNIISFLLRSQKYGEAFLPWYAQAVDEDLRISGIYEAYMMSLPEHSTEELPYRIILYFRYSCSLPYPQRALLYANVVLHRRQNPQAYQQYLRSIEAFAIAQMKQGHMNDNLAIIYQNVVEMGVVDEEMARAMSGLVFTKKLVCLVPDIVRAYVYQEQYQMPIAVPVVDKVAFLPIVSAHYQIFLERSDGSLLSDVKNYSLQKILFPERFLPKLKALAPLALPFILQDFEDKYENASFSADDLGRLEVFLHSSIVAKSYIYRLHSTILELLLAHVREDLLENYFLSEVDYEALDPKTMGYVIGLYLQKGFYSQALPLIEEHGLLLSAKALLPLCDALLESRDTPASEFLQDLAAYVVGEGESTSAICAYLSTHRSGETPWMINLWQQSKDHGLQVVDLEESILFQALYAEAHLEDIVPVFSSYMEKGKDRMLMEAFINYWSHIYMLGQEDVPQELFTILAYFFEREDLLKESCNLAYMKFLSGVNLLSDRELKVLDSLLAYYITRNVYFAFYRKLDSSLQIKYHLYDKYFVEYRGNPEEEIVISYQLGDGEPVEENMFEIYSGIYVKQFVLFHGDTLRYEIYSSDVADLPVAKDEISLVDQLTPGKGDRYDRINRMQNAILYGEDRNLIREIKEYQGLDTVSRQLFTTI